MDRFLIFLNTPGRSFSMKQSLLPAQRARDGQPGRAATRKARATLGLRPRAMLYGVLAAAILTGLIALGSRGFHWFDATLIGYAAASIFAAADSAPGFLIYHALDFTALLLFVGLILALHRRFHDLALITVQRFGFDLMPLALLMAIVVSGLALTADSTWLRGAYYWYISLVHEAVVVLWLISLPFGKFFHLIERPATTDIWRGCCAMRLPSARSSATPPPATPCRRSSTRRSAANGSSSRSYKGSTILTRNVRATYGHATAT